VSEVLNITLKRTYSDIEGIIVPPWLGGEKRASGPQWPIQRDQLSNL
jgi:hypothetical protein